MGGKITENLEFKSPLRKVNFFFFFFSFFFFFFFFFLGGGGGVILLAPMLSNSYGSVWKGRLFSQMTSFPRNDDIHLLFCFYVASFLQSGTVDNFAWIWLFRRVSAEQLKFLQSFTYWLSWVIVGWWNLFGSVSMAVCFDICPNNVVQLSNRNWYFYQFWCHHSLKTQLSTDMKREANFQNWLFFSKIDPFQILTLQKKSTCMYNCMKIYVSNLDTMLDMLKQCATRFLSLRGQ